MTGQSKPIEKHSEGNDGSTVEKDKMKKRRRAINDYFFHLA
jgi:hypothetical protein